MEPKKVFDAIPPSTSLSSPLRIIIPLYFTYFLFVTTLFFIFIPNEKEHVVAQKKEMLQELTQSAWHLLTGYDHQVKTGVLSLETAQKRAIEQIRNLRYGPDDQNYFWILDMHPQMVMHPHLTDLEGKSLTDFKDKEGILVFTHVVEMIQNHGQGYIHHAWQRHDIPSQIAPKITFAKQFSPWSWIIGTGVYTEDIQQEIHKTASKFIIVFALILLTVTLISFYISWQAVLIYRKEQKAQEEKVLETLRLKKSETRYRLLADNATDNIWVITLPDLTFSYMSPSIQQLLGYSPDEYVGQKVGKNLTKASMEKATRLIGKALNRENRDDVKESPYEIFDIEMIKKNGTRIWTEISARLLHDTTGRPDRILGITRDITQRKQLEKRLQQTQKMEALGTLAGGIAHDFNNILSSMMGFTELAKLSSVDNEEAVDNLNMVLSAGVKARDLIKHILLFSRRADVQKHPVQLPSLVKESLNFLSASADQLGIKIQRRLDVNRGLVMADPTQVHQVLMNLFTNALHAMEAKGGVLEVRLSSIEIDTDGQNKRNEHPRIQPGRYFQLTIADTGCGIPGNVMKRIFEPFFTTRKKGEGTGMGLSIAYGIIKDMGGTISVESDVGKGTSFQILLPEQIKRPSTGGDAFTPALLPGKGNILLVDKDRSIIRWTRQLLGKLGYQVTAMTDVPQALAHFKQVPSTYDLVVTDMDMPHLNGLALSVELNRIRPDIPIILVTGFSENLTWEQIKDNGIHGVIMKPVIAGEFVRAITKALKKKR